MSGLTHLDEDGRARMVDVSGKIATDRTAHASGVLLCKRETLAMVEQGRTPKGAVISTAEIAGVMAAKRTADLIPLCHPLPLTNIAVTIQPDSTMPGLRVVADVSTYGVTGVEMEALTAVSVACLTLFDMLKAVDRTMEIGSIMVEEKTGGKSSSWDGT